MYEAYYNLKAKPFSLLPDPDFLYLGQKHKGALDQLEYGLINQAGFIVISGEIGAGKTTLVRHLLNLLGDSVNVGLISNTHAGLGDLLPWILYAFRQDYKGKGKIEQFDTFVEFLVGQYARNERTLLIVDEAQNLGADGLEELRMLSNLNADKDQLFQIILVGQPNLRDLLRKPELVQFAQRIAVDYHLGPLDKDETAEYIRHRIRVAGGNPQLFDAAACDAVHDCTGGVPRLINLLCDTSLVYGYATGQPIISETLIREAAKDKKAGGLSPLHEKKSLNTKVDTAKPMSRLPSHTISDVEPVTPLHDDNKSTAPVVNIVPTQSATNFEEKQQVRSSAVEGRDFYMEGLGGLLGRLWTQFKLGVYRHGSRK